MRTAFRLLVAGLLALALALPGISGGGGGGPGGGSTGVWVLPLSVFLDSDPLGAPRDVHTGVSVSEPLVLQTSGEGDGLTATFCDELSNEPIALPVTGELITIPAELLQALAQQPGSRADVVIADAAMRGYVVRIVIAADRTATVRVY